MKISIVFFLIIIFFGKSFSQDSLMFLASSPEFNRARFVSSVSLQTVGYGSSLVLLSKAWYNDYNQSSLHFFDDSNEWLQIDKAGHLTTSWYLGRIGCDMMEWSGVNKKKSIWYGSIGSYLYLTGIETLDGFSSDWGFSWSDFAANTIGAGFIIGQKFIQYSSCRSPVFIGLGNMSLKFSFNRTDYPQYRPSLLGGSFAENILKDYNGQTYWMSFNLSSFMNSETKFPKWLNVALGYGGEGMISGKPGFIYVNEHGNKIEFERYRQYYLSLDIDLTRIKTKSHFLKTVFETFSFIKIPAPSFELSKYGMKFHPLYY